MRRATILVASLLLGCQEYNLQGGGEVYAEPNPPDLAPPVQTDEIVQVTIPSVDVLWVIDNSCSMSEEQAALSSSFPQFIGYFLGSGLDYHIGVTSTGWDDGNQRGKLREASGQRWIDPDSSNPNAMFTSMATMGTDGPGDEKGRAQVYGALELLGESYNAGFEREDASLAIIVISDENDYSQSTPISKNEFIGWLLDRKADPSMVTFSSIVGPPGGCATAEEGTDYLDVTEAIGGIEWSICSSDWDQVLELLGMQAAGLKREFFLSRVPVPGTIEVWVEDDGERTDFEEEVDWTYDRARNSVLFAEFVPNPLSEVFVEYQVLAGAVGEN